MTTEFKETQTTHRALTQLFRWYQLFERPLTPERIALQLEILDKDIELDLTYGQGKGHAVYLAGMRALPATDRHAHHVHDVAVKALDDARTALEADVTYQQLTAEGALHSTKLHYTMSLQQPESGLPRFTSIQVRVRGAGTDPAFVDAYPISRVRSFMHYWLLLMENIGHDAAPFEELLASDGFTLHFSSAREPLTTLAQLAHWHQGVAGQIKQSSHHPHNLQVQVVDEQTFAASVEFDWLGSNQGGALMTARTRHQWLLHDTGERFLRLKHATATALQPLAPLTP